MKNTAIVPLILSFGMILSSCQTTDLPGKNKDVDPAADALLKAMSDKLKSARQLSYQVERRLDADIAQGRKVPETASIDVVMQRPNKVRSFRTKTARPTEFYYDGKTVTLVDKTGKDYATAPAPGNIDDMIDQIEAKWGIYPPLADLVVADPYASLQPGIVTGKVKGTESVNGEPCTIIAFNNFSVGWTVWISDRDKLPRRVKAVFKDGEARSNMSADISNWNLNPSVTASTFKAKLPSGAQKVEMIPLD